MVAGLPDIGSNYLRAYLKRLYVEVLK